MHRQYWQARSLGAKRQQAERSSYQTASSFLEKPSYELHDVYRALEVIGDEVDLIQAEVYKNSNLLMKRNHKVLYYDCTNYYFEIEQEDGIKKYGKSKEQGAQAKPNHPDGDVYGWGWHSACILCFPWK